MSTQGYSSTDEILASMVSAEETHRLSMLIVHGFYKTMVGICIIVAAPKAFVSPSWWWLKLIPAGKITVGSIVLSGGVLILLGLFTHRNWRIQIAGLALVMVFDFMLAVGFGIANATWEPTAFGAPAPPYYPVFVYLHFFTIMLLQIVKIVSWRGLLTRVHRVNV